VTVWTANMSGARLRTNPEPVIYEVDPVRRTSVAHPIGAEITQGKSVFIAAIEEDPQGRLWLGISIGLMRFDPPAGSFHYYPHTHPDAQTEAIQRFFNDMAWDRSGHLWAHMPAGLERFDPRSGAFDRFTEVRLDRMSQNLAGRLWLWGEFAGLKVFDPSAPAETALKSVSLAGAFGQSLGSPAVHGLGTGRRGNVWVSPFVGSPVHRYLPLLARFGSHVSDPADGKSLSGGEITGFAEDADGSVWISSHSAGRGRQSLGKHGGRNFELANRVPGRRLVGDRRECCAAERRRAAFAQITRGAAA
jgi:ligand-binding sensor domain-containing protein